MLRQPAEEREQPQGHLREGKHADRRQLDEPEEHGRDLSVVERPEQVGVAAVEEIRREHRLVAPEREVQQVADDPDREPESDEPQRRLRDPRRRPAVVLPAAPEDLQRTSIPARRGIHAPAPSAAGTTDPQSSVRPRTGRRLSPSLPESADSESIASAHCSRTRARDDRDLDVRRRAGPSGRSGAWPARKSPALASKMFGTNVCGLRSMSGNQVLCTCTMIRWPFRNV